MTARSRIRAALPWLVMLAGLAFLARPIALQWWEAWQASRGIDAIVSTYDAMGDPEREAVRAEARAYNEALAAGEGLSGRAAYTEQLSWRGSEMIAYIEIPACSVRLPIYHGTDDKVLMAGVGHLEGTSLPVGGRSAHCVLTAHTGMPGRVMFDDIRLLEPGDRFAVWVLGEPVAYEVTGSEVVLPDEVSSLAIVPGRDLCTLVTCTPYGVNTHRLLVHAERCAYEDGGAVPDLAVYVNDRTAPLLAALCALLALGGSLLRRKSPRADGAPRDELPNGDRPALASSASQRGLSPLAARGRPSAIGDSPLRLAPLAKAGQSPKATACREMCARRSRASMDVAPQARRMFPCWERAAAPPPLGTVPFGLLRSPKRDSPQRLLPAGIFPHRGRAAKRGLSHFGEQREPKGTVPFGSPEQPTCHAS